MDTSQTPPRSRASIAPPSIAARQAAAAAAAAVPPPLQPAGAPDVGALLRRILSHWQVVFVTMALGAVITAQVVHTRKALFKSETVVYYREGIARNVTGSSEVSPDTLRTLGAKLKETLLAQQNLKKIIEENHLYPDTVSSTGYAEAVDLMRKKTEFKSRSTDTFAISFEGTTRDEAQKVCGRMATLLVSEMAKRTNEDMKSIAEFLEVEKKRADEELARREKEVSEFLALHPEFLKAKDSGVGIEALTDKDKADADLKERKKLIGVHVGGGRVVVSAPAGPGAKPVDPVLLQARSAAMTELMAARKDLDAKALKFTDQHPDVHAAQEHVQAAEANLQRAEDAIIAATPPPEAPAAAAAVPDDPYGEGHAGAPKVGGGPGPVAAESATDPATSADAGADPDADTKKVSLEMEWGRLARMITMARTHQADLDQRLYKADLVESTAESGYNAKIQVLDPAFRPSSPSNAPNKTVAIIGFLASIVVGLTVSATWGLFFDDRVFAASEIEAFTLVPVLGVVPRSKKKKGKVAVREGLAVSRTAEGDAKPAGKEKVAVREGLARG